MLPLFLTSVIQNRIPIFTDEHPEFVEVIIKSLKTAILRDMIVLHEIALMPNHLHLLYTPNTSFENFHNRFHSFTGHEIIKANSSLPKKDQVDFNSGKSDREFQVWRRYSKLLLAKDLQSFFVFKKYIQNNLDSEFWDGYITAANTRLKSLCKPRVMPF